MGLPTSMIKDIEGTHADDWAFNGGLDWNAEKVPLHYFPRDGVMRDSSMVSVVRDDTGEELGIVSSRYQIVQPKQILEGFDNAVNQLGAGFKMDGIGLYDNGKIIWGRASSDQTIRIKGQDSINSYLYMVTSFDGSVATMGFVSTLREVCSNALHLASKKGDKLFSLSHRSLYKGQAVSSLDTYMNRIQGFENDVNKMADIRLTPTQITDFYADLLYPKKSDFTDRETNVLSHYMKSAALGKGSTLESVKADENGMSLWGAINGVTNVVDNEPVRKATDASKACKSTFIGAGNNLKNKAWNMAMKLAA